VKLKIYVVDFEIPARVKTWGIRIGILTGLLGTATIAIAANRLGTPWATGDTLQAADLNDTFSNVDGRVAALEGLERVRQAKLGSDGVISSQTGSWISVVNHAGAGNYVLTFAANTFSATPTCVATASAGNQIAPSIEIIAASTTGITCNATAASKLTGDVGGNVDTGIFLICIGPK
jgi:hypothetical protein